MGWWRVDADTLAGSRFAVSPLAETVAALKTLHDGVTAHPGERRWLDAHLPPYRRRLGRDAVAEALVRAALRPRWNATFLTPVPPGDEHPDFAREAAQVRGTPPAVVRDDLAEALGRPLPELLRRDDLAANAADLLAWVWHETVEPYWPQRRRIIEADIVARTTRLGQNGWAAALADLRPGMRWIGGNRLKITRCGGPPLELADAQLMFVPVSHGRSWVCWDVPVADGRRTAPGRRFAVVYPCSGALAGGGPSPVPQALAALLGPARAEILALLETPLSTTQLVALTGLPLGSVGRHLRILREAQLVRRSRSGRSVLYYRAEAGQLVVAVQAAGAAP